MQDWQAFTAEIVEELLEDGSNSEAMHLIEHHFSSTDFAKLEAAAVAAFKEGYDVGEPEEFVTEEGEKVIGFDIEVDCPLEEEAIMEDIDNMLKLASEHGIDYDGWGTYFEE